jgi:hypothetical protein
LVDLFDNLYLIRVHVMDSPTTSAFVIHVYIPDTTPNTINSRISAKLDEIRKNGAPTSSEHIAMTMAVESNMNTDRTIYIDDEYVASDTNMMLPHLKGATYGLTFLANRQYE